MPGLLMDMVTLPLNRKGDPFLIDSPLISVDQAIQLMADSLTGKPNGEVPLQMMMFGPARAARAVGGWMYYFILNPNGESQVVRVIVEMQDPARVKMGEQILSTITFSN